jgi:hypothetical protein
MNVNKQGFVRYLKTAYIDSFPDHFSFILNLKVGNVLTADLFYNDNSVLEKWAKV